MQLLIVLQRSHPNGSAFVFYWDVRGFYNDYNAETKGAVEAVFDVETVMGCVVSYLNGSSYFLSMI